MSSSKIVVCSFYTADDYYRQHGERLAKNLSALGVEVVLREIQKKDGEDWADNTLTWSMDRLLTELARSSTKEPLIPRTGDASGRLLKSTRSPFCTPPQLPFAPS